jgi:alanyl-tRNA synthetase
MTERLYFDDPYIQTFTARVVDRREIGGRAAVALDRSAFYPEGGGQPGDRGTLNALLVLDTQADDADVVWHIVSDRVLGDEVEGRIDWDRRWDFMQQHHGQHLLSAAAENQFGARTLAVHLGEEVCTVDLDHPGFGIEQLAELEDATNAMIWADVPIVARFVTPDELQSLTLRKPPQAYDNIRIVSAGDFDHSPCGGTHPRRTGEVGSVLLRRAERYKGGMRIEFVCGGRAVREYRAKNRIVSAAAADLNVGYAELPIAIERLRAAEERSRKALERAQERLVEYEAAALIERAERIGDTPVVVAAFDDRALDNLRLLARTIAERGGVALLGLRAEKAQLVFNRAAGAVWDMGALLRTAAAIVGGRGGGKVDAAQGGGPDVLQLDAALAAAQDELRRTAA